MLVLPVLYSALKSSLIASPFPFSLEMPIVASQCFSVLTPQAIDIWLYDPQLPSWARSSLLRDTDFYCL